MCDCISFVERSLPVMERILMRKALQDASGKGETPCVEITSADLVTIMTSGNDRLK
jgi:hypothetical protein